MALVFVIGYAGIIFEESLAFNKSGVGLLMAVSLWVIRSIGVRFVTHTDYLRLSIACWSYFKLIRHILSMTWLCHFSIYLSFHIKLMKQLVFFSF